MAAPKDPTWQITAARVIHEPARRRISYQGATLNLFGIPIVGLPGLSHPDRSEGVGGSGLLVPDVRISRTNGLELSVPYYLRLAPNRDATITPHIFTDALPMIEGEFRHLLSYGAYQLRGYLTYGERGRLDLPGAQDEAIRGYLEGNGRFQLSPRWSLISSARIVSDRTFLRRYDISLDTRLRSVIQAERIDLDSYINIAAWGFQGLRQTDNDGQQPIVLPAIDARFRMADPIAGGRIELQANSLNILRTEGQDTQRAFASARWDRRMLTPFGQELTLTALARGDIYHSSDNELTPTFSYRGEGGFQTRFIGALAADLAWPFIGTFMNGTQRLTPRIQLVASPVTENLDIPNEDSRGGRPGGFQPVRAEPLPGYDRWEDGRAVTYGRRLGDRPSGRRDPHTIGQSYHLDGVRTSSPRHRPGRPLLRFRRADHRARSAAGSASRTASGSTRTISRCAATSRCGGRIPRHLCQRRLFAASTATSARPIEDLNDRERSGVGGASPSPLLVDLRFGGHRPDRPGEDPLSRRSGFDPVRHRIGILYDDDCFEIRRYLATRL
jgi:LPS-assembly protein